MVLVIQLGGRINFSLMTWFVNAKLFVKHGEVTSMRHNLVPGPWNHSLYYFSGLLRYIGF